jgi:eukaryotic-like serine/threonine-protein kinase
MKTELPSIGQYELQQRLGQNSIGEVWQAYDSDLRRAVAVKFFRTDPADTADSLARYVQEVERIASLHHHNIVSIHDIHVLPSPNPGSSASLICLAMEYVEGGSLADYIASTSAAGRIPPPSEVVQIFTSIARAINIAHQHDIVHGNLKPTNILLKQNSNTAGRMGTPLLTDFGTSKLLPNRNGHDIPFYLAPEQIKGAPAEERSDIYTLGVILYELYTGVLPFRGNRPVAVMMQHINALPTPPDLVNPTLSPALTQVILRCLAKDPRERYPDAASLVIALAEALHVAVPEDLRRSAVLLDGTTSFASPRGTLPRIPSFPSKRKRRSNPLVITTIIALTLLLSAGFGTLLLLAQRGSSPPAQATGHAFFMNSGQLNESSNQGINDELQIELSNVPDPALGKSYYAWLLGDTGQTEAVPLFLGHLTVDHSNVHFLYPGGGQHVNLLGLASRFLITEDDAHHPSSNPLLDQSTWRYYAAIPQTPNPADKLHFSMLDHLRHLLVESPELSIRGLHGGLAFWFARDTATISDLANTLAADWNKKDTVAIHEQIVRMLDYLDGVSFVNKDVPPGTPLLANKQDTQVALLGPAPQDGDPPGYVYQNEAPPGYVYLIQAHMNGAILSPQTTTEQRQLAIQINGGIDSVRHLLAQVYQDAKQLVGLTGAQLLQPSALTLLDDIATQAQYAYTGRPNPSTGIAQGGVLWIYDNLQRLATFDVTPYIASKS